jgi:NNP family nitrate/nitrite transporter-like MFS transporter
MFGPRRVFGGLLLVGSIPLGLAPLIHNATGLYVSRFFIGILGGSFVPCQVWSTGFFDKNIVGTANALTGGFGNAGGGITYFIMPAVYDSFIRSGHTAGKSWRLTFIVPLIMVIVTGIALLLLCPDTPMGKWSERHLHVQENLESHGVAERVVDIPGAITDKATPSGSHNSDRDEKKPGPVTYDHETPLSKTEMIETAQGETVVKPTFREALPVIFSQQTAFHVLTYFCSFGGELAINAILSSYYLKNFPKLGQTKASNWAAMFGFLNFVTRPLGGVVGDLLYNLGGRNLWLKKGWITTCGVVTGALLVLIGRINPHDQSTMYGLVALMAFFLEAGNGANFALVPHVHPFANGILSGVTGAGGNLGGVVFAVIFRFMGGGTDYAKAFWVIGVMHIGINLAVSWIRPLPKGQIGGH